MKRLQEELFLQAQNNYELSLTTDRKGSTYTREVAALVGGWFWFPCVALGSPDMTTVWSEYRPEWPAQAAQAIDELQAGLPESLVVIEHVGSTSVPGLAAKAVIDLMAATDNLEQVASQVATLEQLGYRHEPTPMPNRLFFPRDTDGVRTHHLHVVTVDTWDTRNERLLRDHLRSHPADAERYAELKRSLVDQYGAGGDDYTFAKTELIQELVDRARDARGLPREPVWED